MPARSQVRILGFSEILVTDPATAIPALAFEEQDAGSGATPKTGTATTAAQDRVRPLAVRHTSSLFSSDWVGVYGPGRSSGIGHWCNPALCVHRLLLCVHGGILATRGHMMAGKTRSHKHFRLDPVKIKRAQRVLRVRTETEAIERALDLVILEYERNRLTAEANDRFVTSGIDIKDVYGTLES